MQTQKQKNLIIVQALGTLFSCTDDDIAFYEEFIRGCDSEDMEITMKKFNATLWFPHEGADMFWLSEQIENNIISLDNLIDNYNSK